MDTLYRPRLPSNEAIWRKARIGALLVLWLHPLVTGPFLRPEVGFVTRLIRLVTPSLHLLVMGGLIAWQVYCLRRPPSPKRIALYPNHHDATEWISIGTGVFLGLAFELALSTGSLDRLFQNIHMAVPPPLAGPLIELVVMLLVYGWPLFIITVDHTVIDAEQRTVTRFFLWPRRFSYDEVTLGEIRVQLLRNGAKVGINSYVALFPTKGSPWKAHLSTPEGFGAQLQELNALTGLPIGRTQKLTPPS